MRPDTLRTVEDSLFYCPTAQRCFKPYFVGRLCGRYLPIPKNHPCRWPWYCYRDVRAETGTTGAGGKYSTVPLDTHGHMVALYRHGAYRT